MNRLVAFVVLFSVALGLNAQTTTGSITGTVLDPSGSAIVDADVELISSATQAKREAKTNGAGLFDFNVLEPGIYSLSVAASGFRREERKQINLTASERLALGNLTLQVGNVSDSVVIQAIGAVVQTESAEHSGVLTTDQVENLLIKGRNVTTLLQLLPGVVDTNAPDAPDRNFAIGLSVNGQRRNAVGTWIDGVPTQDSGVGWIATANISMDAVAEVKVLLNNYQAEYGRMRGAGVQMIGKSGTRDFHGSFSYFKRNESYNANDFFSNRLGLPIARYRYNMYSYTIGGPVYIPKHWNKDRNKLFFFWSQELWPQQVSVPVTTVRMPTALERTGNFSQTFDTNGKLIPIKDPTTGQPFPGNIVPANRIDPNGQALLNYFPQPNFSDVSVSKGQYNYTAQPTLDKPQHLQTMKIDYHPTSKDLIYVTWSRQLDQQTGTMGLATPNANWPLELRTFETIGNILSGHYQKIITPTLVNELVLGYNWRNEHEDVPADQFARLISSNIGFRSPQLYPTSNPQGLLPNVTFGGVPNTPTITLTSIPEGGGYPTYIVTDNISKTLSNHTLKAGVFFNRPAVHNVASANRGALNFSTDVNNPLETGYTFANALLGVFSSYSQASGIVATNNIETAFEWFGQDTWKVNRRVTLELGIRFVYSPPIHTNHPAGLFQPQLYDPKQAISLITPTLVNGVRVGIDPRSGAIYPAVAIGSIAPNSGNIANGIVLNTQPGVSQAIVGAPPISVDPRFGFAWDVFGNGRTAVRGGFGIFQSAGATGEGQAASESIPPLIYTANIPYSTLSSVSSTSGLIAPVSVGARQDPQGLAASYNVNFDVQQQIGYGTVFQVGYVATLGRHLSWGFDLDPVPLGADFLPSNADPTNPKVALPANFLRAPYYGYSGVTYVNWGATSNYHALQATLNRRFAKGLQLGVSYTFSKFLTAVDFDGNVVSPFVPARIWNYGPSTYDRAQNLRMNWIWDIPSPHWNNAISRWTLGGWQFSGINSFISGSPASVSFATTNNADISGTASATPRPVITCNPNLSGDQKTFYRQFNTACFALPAVGTLGDPAHAYLRNPGINNWDLSLFKNLPIREPMKIQLRLEAYNAFNHTQFATMDTTARFDASGNLTNTTFGQILSSRTPRQVQIAARFTF